MNNDYLKYWRVIRYFIKAKYDLTTADLDMLLFLKSEGRFDKDKFDDFNEMAIQFGYLALFSPVYPLAPAMALANNILEIRIVHSHGNLQLLGG